MGSNQLALWADASQRVVQLGKHLLQLLDRREGTLEPTNTTVVEAEELGQFVAHRTVFPSAGASTIGPISVANDLSNGEELE
jgi:hypothetical protein